MDIVTPARHPASMPRPWTDAENDLLRALWAQGYSKTEIARRIGGGISRTGIRNQLDRLRISHKPVAAIEQPERTDPLALLKRQATLPLPMPMPFAHPKTCQWPMWKDDERPGMDPRFCGVRAEAGKPYCACHWAKAHRDRC